MPIPRIVDCESKIDHANAPLIVDDQVVGLDVAMDESRGVRRREAAGGIGEHARDLAPGSGLGGPASHRLATDELHREEHAAAPRPDVVDRDDMGMRQARQGAALAQRAGVTLGVGVADDLERDCSTEVGVIGLEHVTHGARATHRAHDVAADRRADRDPLVARGVGHLAPGAHRRGDLSTARFAALHVPDDADGEFGRAAADVAHDVLG